MSLPKKLSTGGRYLPSSAFNCYIDILNPDAGQATDGTPNAPTVVATGIHANLQPWRAKEVDKAQTRIGQSAFKIVVRYPKTYTIDSGMVIHAIRGGVTTLHNIEAAYDPDGQQVELHIWTWVSGGIL